MKNQKTDQLLESDPKSISEYVDRDDVEHIRVHSEFYIDPDFAPSLGATRLVL